MVNIVAINRGRSLLTVHFLSIFLRKYKSRVDDDVFPIYLQLLGSRNNLSRDLMSMRRNFLK